MLNNAFFLSFTIKINFNFIIIRYHFSCFVFDFMKYFNINTFSNKFVLFYIMFLNLLYTIIFYLFLLIYYVFIFSINYKWHIFFHCNANFRSFVVFIFDLVNEIILKLFFGSAMPSLISSVGPARNTKKYFDDSKNDFYVLLSTPKITVI